MTVEVDVFQVEEQEFGVVVLSPSTREEAADMFDEVREVCEEVHVRSRRNSRFEDDSTERKPVITKVLDRYWGRVDPMHCPQHGCEPRIYSVVQMVDHVKNEHPDLYVDLLEELSKDADFDTVVDQNELGQVAKSKSDTKWSGLGLSHYDDKRTEKGGYLQR